jgi:hypothetical protein
VRAPRRRGPGGGEGVEREVDDDGAVGVPAAALAAARPGLPLLRHVGHLPTVQEEDLVAHWVHRYDGFSDPVAQPTGAMERPAVAVWGFAAAWRGRLQHIKHHELFSQSLHAKSKLAYKFHNFLSTEINVMNYTL